MYKCFTTLSTSHEICLVRVRVRVRVRGNGQGVGSGYGELPAIKSAAWLIPGASSTEPRTGSCRAIASRLGKRLVIGVSLGLEFG